MPHTDQLIDDAITKSGAPRHPESRLLDLRHNIIELIDVWKRSTQLHCPGTAQTIADKILWMCQEAGMMLISKEHKGYLGIDE